MLELGTVFSYVELANVVEVRDWNTLYWRLQFNLLAPEFGI
jgi:hypothetical protein